MFICKLFTSRCTILDHKINIRLLNQQDLLQYWPDTTNVDAIIDIARLTLPADVALHKLFAIFREDIGEFSLIKLLTQLGNNLKTRDILVIRQIIYAPREFLTDKNPRQNWLFRGQRLPQRHLPANCVREKDFLLGAPSIEHRRLYMWWRYSD